MIRKNLNGTWKLRDEPLSCRGEKGLARVKRARSGWIAAWVPGEVHLDLKRAGRLEEPLVGLNAKKSRWPEKRSWWFVRTFKVSSSFLAHERQQLIFDGLDLCAEVFLNGTLLGEAKNAFVPQVFDVQRAIRKGVNTLVVRLTAGEELLPKSLRAKPAKRGEVYGGRQRFPGISHLRKPQFTYGWDWVDALPNIGIWRGVRLEAHSGVVLHDLRLDTRLHKTAASLDVAAVVENLHPWSERPGVMDLTLQPPRGRKMTRRLKFSAPVGRSPIACRLEIPDPQLWWPNGMGEQPLYHVTARVLWEGTECDRREMDIGLRTVDIDRSALPAGGTRFCIRVNGQDVFCKGGNWIPADAIIARVDKKKYETLIAEAKQANINMLRIWGGGVYEAPEFYDACDRAGILVWQDFMFACAEYPDDDAEFRSAVRAEAEAVIPMLRHHPSLALWCGNNENIWGFAQWWNADKSFGEPDLRIGGSVLYNQILPDACRALDPCRPYWPSSPFGGETPNAETEGDCHWWLPFTMNPDVNRRIRHEVFDECRSRFVSEYGVIGPCHWASVKEYLEPKQRHVSSPAWQEHTNTYEKETLPAAIRRHYAGPEPLEIPERILYGQMFQAVMYGRTIEALRFRKNDPRDDCQGALIWMYNDCWGETGWTPIDYYLRRKPSYYWIRQANAPLKPIVRRRGRSLVTRVVNDTRERRKVTLRLGWMRGDGSAAKMRSKVVQAPANGMVEVDREAIPGRKSLDPREWIYAAYFTSGASDSGASIWTLVPHRELALPEPDIRVTRRGNTLRLLSKTYCHGVHFRDRGKRLLSDNYFDLLPGVAKNVIWLGPTLPGRVVFHAVV